MKELDRFLKERREALLSYNINKYICFYNRWRKKNYYIEPLPRDKKQVTNIIIGCITKLDNITYSDIQQAQRKLK